MSRVSRLQSHLRMSIILMPWMAAVLFLGGARAEGAVSCNISGGKVHFSLAGCPQEVLVNDRATTQTNTPVIIFPSKDLGIRGDNKDCTNFIAWKITTQPSFRYICAINKING